MTKISIPIKDNLAQALGIEYLKKYFSRQMELLELQQVADKIGKTIQKVNINWDKEFDKARQLAWKEYKSKLSGKK